eukprot:582138-Prymnesium_polylepis.1
MRCPPAETPLLSGAGSHQPMQRPSATHAPLSISPCPVLHPRCDRSAPHARAPPHARSHLRWPIDFERETFAGALERLQR